MSDNPFKNKDFSKCKIKSPDVMRDLLARAKAVSAATAVEVVRQLADGQTELELLRFITDASIGEAGRPEKQFHRLSDYSDDEFTRLLTNPVAISFNDGPQIPAAGGQRQQQSGHQAAHRMDQIDNDDLARLLTNPSSMPFFD